MKTVRKEKLAGRERQQIRICKMLQRFTHRFRARVTGTPQTTESGGEGAAALVQSTQGSFTAYPRRAIQRQQHEAAQEAARGRVQKNVTEQTRRREPITYIIYNITWNKKTGAEETRAKRRRGGRKRDPIGRVIWLRT